MPQRGVIYTPGVCDIHQPLYAVTALGLLMGKMAK